MKKCEWNDGRDKGRYWEENPCPNPATHRTTGFRGRNFNLCEDHAKHYAPYIRPLRENW